MNMRISYIEVRAWADIKPSEFDDYDIIEIDGDGKVVLCGRYASPYQVSGVSR